MHHRLTSLLIAVSLASCSGSAANLPSVARGANNAPPTQPSTGRSPQVQQTGDGSRWVELPDILQPLGPTTFVRGLQRGADGFLWATVRNASAVSAIAKVDQSGQVVLFNYFGETGEPCSGSGTTLARANDGSMWFAYGLASEPATICRFAANGAPTAYLIPGIGSAAVDNATAGPDGDIWFSYRNFNTEAAGVGKITLSGVATTFPTPVPVNSMVFGPDGNIWFVADTVVGKITTKGQTTTYALPQASVPYRIMAGSDGTLYFAWQNGNGTGRDANAIVRMTTSGKMTFYAVPGSTTTPRFGPIDLYNGPGSLLWFIGPNGLQSFSTLTHRYGAIENLPFTTTSMFGNFVAAPNGDGNLWIWYSGHFGTYVLRDMTVSPTSLTMSRGQHASIAVTETSAMSRFYARSNNANVVIVSPGSEPSTGCDGAFTVTASGPGNATISISDGLNPTARNFVQVSVTVH